jgi:hypothetical protein
MKPMVVKSVQVNIFCYVGLKQGDALWPLFFSFAIE